MGKVLQIFSKFIVANLAVVLTIMLLPVFLVTDDIELFTQVMDYLFNNKKS